jgi:uncharacterized membrane protein (UPF0127 family)
MTPNCPFFALLVLLPLLLSCRGAAQESPRAPSTVTFEAEGKRLAVFEVEVVSNPADRARGLMFRESLAPDRGMLFIFEAKEEHPFWMKNTLISLDLIFLDDDGTVLGTIRNAKTQSEASLSIKVPSRYVLEVPAGTCGRLGIQRGVRGIVKL